MKVLQTLEEAITFAIIRENSSDPRINLHRIHNTLASFCYACGPIFLILFIYLDAKTFEEYEEVIPFGNVDLCWLDFLGIHFEEI